MIATLDKISDGIKLNVENQSQKIQQHLSEVIQKDQKNNSSGSLKWNAEQLKEKHPLPQFWQGLKPNQTVGHLILSKGLKQAKGITLIPELSPKDLMYISQVVFGSDLGFHIECLREHLVVPCSKT